MRHPRAVLAAMRSGLRAALPLLHRRARRGDRHRAPAARSRSPPAAVAPPALPAPVIEPPAPVPALQRAVDAELNRGTLEFATGKAVLDSTARWCWIGWRRCSGRTPGAKVEIVGHTDALGTPDRNQILSEARAESVKAYLVAARGERRAAQHPGRGRGQSVG